MKSSLKYDKLNSMRNNRKVNYKGLNIILANKGLKKTDLLTMVPISSATLAKIGNNKIVSLTILVNICNTLDCQLNDIITLV